LCATFAWISRCIEIKVEISGIVDVTKDIVVVVIVAESCVAGVVTETRVVGGGTDGEVVAWETEFVAGEGSVKGVGEVDVVGVVRLG
jgi:hypothetical protein